MTTEFSQLPLAASLIQVVDELGFEKLTPIQARSIPLLLEGKDVVGQAQTGSGKTAAFALPILHKVELTPRRIQALVLCPTRELCTQVARDIRKLGRRHAGLQVLILCGGTPIHPQLDALEKGVHIAVGTPGRVLDHIHRKTLDLRQVTCVVLDEADRMLDMGFQEDMEKILVATPKARQTVFFSATFPKSFVGMSRAHQKDPVLVSVEETPESVPEIVQRVQVVAQEDKRDALLALLALEKPESAMVFCNHKVTVDQLAAALEKAGVSTAGLHGDLEQNDRDRVMARFRNHSVRVLVATDVAARGLDIADLDLVVNYDLPSQPEVYVHRIGRTGRAGKKGLAVALATPRETGRVQEIERFAGATLVQVKAPAPSDEAPTAGPSFEHLAKMQTLYISGGRKDKMRPGDILGALTGEAGGLAATDVGKIEIHDRFAYVAVSTTVAQAAVEALSKGKIKGRRFKVGMVD